MTTFARKSFDVAGYLACRPTYPQTVYDAILGHHSSTGRFDRAVDLGCGPGFVALNLAPRFKQVLALDPAAKMVESGLQPSDPAAPRITYKVGNAEDLQAAGVGAGEQGVDLAVAGQAAHWFDYPKVWRQLTRSVRPGGTVAFIGYAEMVFPSHPHLNNLITHHSSTVLGSYWQPGRKIVEALLDPVPFAVPPTTPPTSQPELTLSGRTFGRDLISEPALPDPENDSFDFSSWDPNSAVRLKSLDGTQWLMRKKFTLRTLEGYLRTWSALHAYHEAHPDDATKKGKGKDGDVVDRLMLDIAAGLRESGTQMEEDDEVEGGWPLVLMMIKKRV